MKRRRRRKEEYETTSTTNIDTTHQNQNQTNEVFCESFSDYNYQIANQFCNGWVCRMKTTKHSNLICNALNHLYFIVMQFHCIFYFSNLPREKCNRSAAMPCGCGWAVHAVRYANLCVSIANVSHRHFISNSTRTALMSGSTEPIHVQAIHKRKIKRKNNKKPKNQQNVLKRPSKMYRIFIVQALSQPIDLSLWCIWTFHFGRGSADLMAFWFGVLSALCAHISIIKIIIIDMTTNRHQTNNSQHIYILDRSIGWFEFEPVSVCMCLCVVVFESFAFYRFSSILFIKWIILISNIWYCHTSVAYNVLQLAF